MIQPPRLYGYLNTVARPCSIRKAAETWRVASTALNGKILELEKELGTLKSMGLSRAAGALRVAVALGEIEREALAADAIGS